MTKMTKFAMALATGTCAFAVSHASAADLPPIYSTPIYEAAPELQPVEIGNGWYLRGDVGYNFSSESGYHAKTRELIRSPGAAGILDEDVTTRLSAGIGAGYQFTDWFRGDLTAEWLANGDQSYDGIAACDVDVRSVDLNGIETITRKTDGCQTKWNKDLDIYNYMANAYVDLGTYAGFTPYLGAGAGLANVQSTYKNTKTCNEGKAADIRCVFPPRIGTFGEAKTVSPDDHDDSTWQLSYALMAGMSYAFDRNLSLDVGYRYLDIPEIDMFGSNFDEGIQMHQIRAGVRYSLW